MSNEQGDQPGVQLAGFAVLACIAVLAASSLATIVAWCYGDWAAGGTCLVAAAISSGFLLNAVTRR